MLTSQLTSWLLTLLGITVAAAKKHGQSKIPSVANELAEGKSSGSLSGLATSTLYFDRTGGACGCFDDANYHGYDEQFGLSDPEVYFAAGSQSIFNHDYNDDGKNGWCGSNCGKCFKLTSQGKAACDGCGKGSKPGLEVVVMIYDNCPPSYKDAQGSYHYCAPKGVKNKQGYDYHFDIHSSNITLGGREWDNPVVKFEKVDCPAKVVTWYNSKCKKCAGN